MKRRLIWLVLGIGAAVAMGATRPATAGKLKPRQTPQGEVGEVGDVEMNFYFAFPPTQDDIDLAKHQIRRASQVLCDVTDGGVKIASVDLGISKFSGEIADVTWYPDGVFGGRSYGSTTVRWGDPGSYTQGDRIKS